MPNHSPTDLVRLIGAIEADLVVLGPADLAGRHPGEHGDNFGAGVMVQPGSTAAAAALVEWAGRHGIAIVSHGGRSGLVGGNVSHPGQIILSSARLNRIEAIHAGEATAVVGGGVTLQALQEEAAKHGLTPGIDLAARGSATVGGMVSTNAGGILAFRNGVMRHQILGLEAVLPDGAVFSDMTRVVKVSAGPDIKQLLIGAEGAFGFVTRVVVKLEAQRTERATALIGVDSAAVALRIVSHFAKIAAVQLEAAELMWARFFTDSCKAQGFDAGFLDAGTKAVLLIELSAETADHAEEVLEDGLEALWEDLALSGGIVARSIDQSRAFWRLREASEFIYHEHAGAPSFDVSIPPSSLDAYVAGMTRRLGAVSAMLSAYVYGHIADGNLHLSVTGSRDASMLPAIEDAIYRGIGELGGSFSAEHGIGLDKKAAYLAHADPQKQKIARAIKVLLDPDNRFNPGKAPY